MLKRWKKKSWSRAFVENYSTERNTYPWNWKTKSGTGNSQEKTFTYIVNYIFLFVSVLTQVICVHYVMLKNIVPR